MNHKFDELAKGLAQSVARRQALKRFGVGLAGMALACFGLATSAKAGSCACTSDADCNSNSYCSNGYCIPEKCKQAYGYCCCHLEGRKCATGLPSCQPDYAACVRVCESNSVC